MSDIEKLLTDVKSDLYMSGSTSHENIVALLFTIESLENNKNIALNSHQYLENIIAQHEATIESQQQKIALRDKIITAQVGHIDTVNLHLESKDQQISRWKEEYEALKGVGELHLQQIESQREEIDRLREREFNHYPIEIEELESRIFKLQEDLEAAHDAFEMLPPKDVEIHERTQFQIDKTVDRLLIESLQKEIKGLQWAASNAFDNLNKLKSADVEEAKQFLYKVLTDPLRFTKEIESLKAITELAVKGLAVEMNVAIARQNQYGIARLDTVLSEIQRLQNG